jgi:AcrR family transcriptional regulator
VTPAPPSTRRERVRQATTQEITAVARDLVAREGSAGLNLRAVARSLGMAPSALYRYFPSRDALLTTLIVEAYDAVGLAVEQAIERGGPQGCGAILGCVHAFRQWALDHPHEYGLIYGTPVPGYEAPDDVLTPAMRTPDAMLGLLRRGLESGLITLPLQEDDVPEPVRAVLTADHAHHHAGPPFPAHAKGAAMQFWALLLGLVSGEVFGHVPPGGRDFFDFSVRRGLLALGTDPRALAATPSPA